MIFLRNVFFANFFLTSRNQYQQLLKTNSSHRHPAQLSSSTYLACGPKNHECSRPLQGGGGKCSFLEVCVQGPKEAEDERKAGMQAVGNGKLLV